MSQALSPAFAVAIVTAASKPGDASPPLAQIAFGGDVWACAGGIVTRNGKPVPSRFGDNSTTRVYVNTTQIWTTAPHGYSYWNGTAFVWDASHGPDGGYF